MKFFRNKEAHVKMMVCYNASEAAEEALKLAQSYAKRWHAVLDIVCADKREELPGPDGERQIEETFASRIRQRFESLDIPYRTHMLIKPFAVGEQLVMFAENKDFEFIFIGISKRSKTGKLLYGSTAQYIILNAPCPVISTNGIHRIR